MCIFYCCEGRKLGNYWVITSPSLNKEYIVKNKEYIYIYIIYIDIKINRAL